MFPIGSLPNTCSQPRKLLQVALQVTVQWLGRHLSHRVLSCFLFQPPFKYSIQFLTRGFSTGGMTISHVDPGEILLSTQAGSLYVLAVLKSPFTTQSLFTICILLPPVSKVYVVHSLYVGALHKGESHILLVLPFCLSPCCESPPSSGHQSQVSTFDLFGLYSMGC